MRDQAERSDVTRVTLFLPAELWAAVKRLAPAGKRARFVAQALETEVGRRERLEAFERAREFGDALQARYGAMSNCVEDIDQMREERDLGDYRPEP
jgi:hypothetical protein